MDPFPAAALSAAPRSGCPALLDFRVEDLRGRRIDLCAFRGKVLLVVNTASRCGYTPQYEGLQALYAGNKARGLVVLGFPSNDFGGQEPGSSQEIESFCRDNYSVTFPMFGKVTVLGAGKTPFYRSLTAGAAPGVEPGEVAWNFEKFLIGRDGSLLGRYRSKIDPQAPELLAALDGALGK
jgi:glutathione peroxidase